MYRGQTKTVRDHGPCRSRAAHPTTSREVTSTNRTCCLFSCSLPAGGYPGVQPLAGRPVGPLTCDFTSVRAAVDAATARDIVKVAVGSYTGVHAIGGANQLVFITKSVTIKGGHDLDFSEPPDPLTNETRLDAQYRGRVSRIIGDFEVKLEGLTIIGGGTFKASPDGKKCNLYDNYNSLEAGSGIADNGATILRSKEETLSKPIPETMINVV